MKLTIFKIVKLFLLWTALFFLPNSHKTGLGRCDDAVTEKIDIWPTTRKAYDNNNNNNNRRTQIDQITSTTTTSTSPTTTTHNYITKATTNSLTSASWTLATTQLLNNNTKNSILKTDSKRRSQSNVNATTTTEAAITTTRPTASNKQAKPQRESNKNQQQQQQYRQQGDFSAHNLKQQKRSQPQQQQKQQQQQQRQTSSLVSLALASTSSASTSTSTSGSSLANYQRVGVLIPGSLLDKMQVQQGFHNFVDFFQVHLENIHVDFLRDDDLSGFIKLLEQPKYTTIVRTLNAGINFDVDDDVADVDVDNEEEREERKKKQTAPYDVVNNAQKEDKKEKKQKQNLERHDNVHAHKNDNVDLTEGVLVEVSSAATTTTKQQQQQQQHLKQNGKLKQLSATATAASSSSSSTEPSTPLLTTKPSTIGHCHLAEELTRDYNKSVLLWPCPRMKESSNFLPSFEAISFAVKSIATKLNWTKVDIFVGDENWGLPLAIAANLHIPYRIEIGQTIRDLHAQDKPGKAIIITAPMNDDSTLRLLNNTTPNGWPTHLLHTKILLIDIVATSLNAENRFYKYLARINASSSLMSNLLLLTVLSDKYRHFLNVAFEDNDIMRVQNFRQQRQHLNAPQTPAAVEATQAKTTTKIVEQTNWPMHLANIMFGNRYTHETDQKQQQQQEKQQQQQAEVPTLANMKLLSELRACAQFQNYAYDANELCQRIETIALACANNHSMNSNSNNNVSELQQLLTHICQSKATASMSATTTKLPKSNHSATQARHINKNYTQAELLQIEKLRNFIDFFNFYDFLIANLVGDAQNVTHVPKYDFIVLDVVVAAAADAAGGMRDSLHVALGAGIHDGVGDNKMHNNNNNNDFGKMHIRRSNTLKWRPLLILEQHELNSNTYITHSIQPGYDDWLVSSVQLTHCGAICWTIVAICVGMLFVIVAASVTAGIAMRNYFLRKRLSKGPNKIVLSANDFVFPVDSRRVDEGIEAMLCCWLQQLQEFGGPEVDKPDLLKGSIGSLKNLGFVIPGVTTTNAAAVGTQAGTTTTTTTTSAANGKSISASGSLARHNPALLDMRARYNGDLVQLKEIHMNGSNELKAKAMDLLIMAHGLRHENINPLIGWLSDPNRTAMVFDYCSRGSLQDVLIMDEIKLDWSFRLSLLTDLVRGMRYLHTSTLRVHGALTSRNCVVDARWVLKITDYGLNTFYEAQGLAPQPRSSKELLWTAPELLRITKPHHHHHVRVLGTQMADVYSFGIIMQEVVVRGEPYCMLSLSPDEIIAKIKKPPPLIRPSVSKGAAPPEAINIMRQCWAEQPEMRPDFNSVYERFKMLNHGRKVNFVDTMFQMLEKYSNNLEELIRERTEQLDIERKKTEQLLNRMLPSSVAEKLKMGLAVDPEEFADVTIYFSDIVGFTTIAAHCSPVQVVDLLNDLYTIFDATINAYNVYKVETIGDAYMVVSGLPVKIPDHAEQIATMALDLLHQSGRFNVKHLPGVPLQLRIGLHTGPCCAGVVGLTMPRYCLFGDTVNTASRMESTGSSWRIHMSQETRDRLEARGGYSIEPRGLIDIKGKGMMNTFWLLGKKGFDKPLPMPPPIGLDESLIRNSITLKAQANKSRTSTNPSSSQSSSLAGESVEVKVEITPPTNVEICSTNLPNSYSLDSNSTNTISPNMTLCPDFPTKTPSASPQPRKMSELSPDNLLNPNTFNRLPSSAGGSSSRLYKKIEEMMDLSSPYNHYKCLSPSESNLTQFYDGKYLYSTASSSTGIHGAGHSSGGGGSGGTSAHGSTSKFDSKPGSSRLLRRQFSLDRDDTQTKPDQHHQQHHQTSLQANYIHTSSTKSSMLDIPLLHDTARSPKGTLTRAHKQNSTSIAQDLEKIEEIPLSPASSQHHSSLDSNLNRSPPSTVDAQSPPLPTLRGQTTSPPMLSAPASPAPSRTLNGIGFGSMPTPANTESPTTTDASTATTTASVNSNNTTPGEGIEMINIRKPELTLNVETLLSR